MGFEAELEEPCSTPPKLSLFSLPCKTLKMQVGLTPPPHNVAMIPFQWEEAPGKPRSTDDLPPAKSKAARSLDLPPRLSAITTTPSPRTVLSGPYEGQSFKLRSLSPDREMVSCIYVGKRSDKSRIKMPLKNMMSVERPPVKFGSWRWDSFRDSSKAGVASSHSFDDLLNSLHSKVNTNEITRRSSFIISKTTRSGFLANMYGSLKQAVPWRRRHDG